MTPEDLLFAELGRAVFNAVLERQKAFEMQQKIDALQRELEKLQGRKSKVAELKADNKAAAS